MNPFVVLVYLAYVGIGVMAVGFVLTRVSMAAGLHMPRLPVVIMNVGECVPCCQHSPGTHPRCTCGAEGPHGRLSDRHHWHQTHRAKHRQP